MLCMQGNDGKENANYHVIWGLGLGLEGLGDLEGGYTPHLVVLIFNILTKSSWPST